MPKSARRNCSTATSRCKARLQGGQPLNDNLTVSICSRLPYCAVPAGWCSIIKRPWCGTRLFVALQRAAPAGSVTAGAGGGNDYCVLYLAYKCSRGRSILVWGVQHSRVALQDILKSFTPTMKVTTLTVNYMFCHEARTPEREPCHLSYTLTQPRRISGSNFAHAQKQHARSFPAIPRPSSDRKQ